MKRGALALLVIIALISSFACDRAEKNRPAGENEARTTPGPPDPQAAGREDAGPARPGLVVGIIVDQMRYDFLTRFWQRYGDGGFKRLVDNGYSFNNTKYGYVPTTTCPGHASVYTGAVPSAHGIIDNYWYVRGKKERLYCAFDPDASLVGGNGASDPGSGKRSPRNMLTTTVTDELRLATGMRSKVIGVSVKDRGAIMPAGHLGSAAYWLDAGSGQWVTSSYYYRDAEDSGTPGLPEWVVRFNAENTAEKYLARPDINGEWKTLYDVSTYKESIDDDNEFENSIKGRDGKPAFPYVFKDVVAGNLVFKGRYGGLVAATPYGNSLTKDFAIAAITGEGLGGGDVTDFLAVSFSSTDIVGHYHGPRSVEVEDTYLRLDRDLESLLEALDKHVGRGNYLVFLTADHGVADAASYMESLGIPAGYFTGGGGLLGFLNERLEARFGIPGLALDYSSRQIYLDRGRLEGRKDISMCEVEGLAADALVEMAGVADAVTACDLNSAQFTQGWRRLVQRGYNRKRSGDVALILEPAWVDSSDKYARKGTTHSAGYAYDTHVPLVFYGWGIGKGATVRPVDITDIAPTVSALLGIPLPNGASGEPLTELFQ